MRRKKPKLKINYQCVQSDIQFEQGLGFLSEHFLKNQEKIKEKLEKYKNKKSEKVVCNKN